MGKIIYDPIHKYMEFEDILLKIIDTPEFQRLRNIKQLGACYYVYPGAKHNRFEHSLGVSHISGLLISKLKLNQPELNITDRQVILVKIAGLVHDIGHACFSHFFDHKFLSEKDNSPFKDHEFRSGFIFENMVKKWNLDVSSEEISFVKDLIDPSPKHKGYIYQIVANKVNGLDCDKLDYIARDNYNVGFSYSFDISRLIKYAKVIDNKIAFPEKCSGHISHLFRTRYELFRQVYTHPCARSIEYMILDLFNIADKRINFVSKLKDLDEFAYLTDNIIDIIKFTGTKEERDMIEKIQKREFYTLIGNLDVEDIDKFKSMLKTDKIPENKVIIDKVVLNWSMGKENPLDYVYFYKGDSILTNVDYGLMPDTFEETKCRIYSKDNTLNSDLKGIFKNMYPSRKWL